MNLNEFRKANQLAHNYGAKIVVMGKPGTGKTPLLATGGERAAALFTEPGLLSLRKVEKPVGVAKFTRAEIEDFLKWWCESAERPKYFDTLMIDSASQWAEIELAYHLKNTKDGRKAYGDMARNVMRWLERLYFSPNMNVVLITKLEMAETENGVVARPYFPGKELHIRVPHFYDMILWLDYHNIPGHGMARALRCWPSPGAVVRDRSGNLAEYEPADLSAVIQKCLA